MAPPRPKRQGTMNDTADAGMTFLKAQKADSLIRFQGLDKLTKVAKKTPTKKKASPKKKKVATPKPKKTGTMQGTAAEGQELVKWMAAQNKKRKSPKKAPTTPKLKKAGTMVATAVEGAELVQWMGEQNAKKNGKAARPKPKKSPAKKKKSAAKAKKTKAAPAVPSPRKTHTMVETTAAAKRLVEPNMGESRSASKANKKVIKASKKKR